MTDYNDYLGFMVQSEGGFADHPELVHRIIEDLRQDRYMALQIKSAAMIGEFIEVDGTRLTQRDLDQIFLNLGV